MHDLIILANALCTPEMAEASGLRFRCELPINGKAMLDRVIEAVQPFGDPILVGGPERPGIRQVAGGETFVDSLRIANTLASTPRYLLLFADLPDLKTESVRRFLSDCDPEAGVNYPIVPVELCLKEYPTLPRTTLKLREGHFTGGNLALIDPQACQKAMPIVQRAYAARKNPLALGRIAGLGTLARIAGTKAFPNAISIRGLESSISKFLKMPVKAVIVHAADIGTDIDSWAQYQAIVGASVSE